MAQGAQLSREFLEACVLGQSETVGKLLSRGADPSRRGVQLKKTPLHWASGYVYVCAWLIQTTSALHSY